MIAPSGCTSSTCGSRRDRSAPLGRSGKLAHDMSGPPVEARPPAAAFFDLDKTIIAGSSALAFSRPFRRQGLITRRAALRSGYAQLLIMLSGADAATVEPCAGGSPRCAPAGRSPRSARSWPRRCTRSSNRSSTPRPPSSSPSTGRTVTRSWCCRRRGWRSSSPSPRSSAPTAARPPAWPSATGATPGRSSSTLRRAEGAGRPRHRRRAGVPAGGLPGVLRLDHRPAAARGGRAPDGGQPGSCAAPGGRGARLADPDLRRFRSPCARGSGRRPRRRSRGGRAGGGRARRCRVVRAAAADPADGRGATRHGCVT